MSEGTRRIQSLTGMQDLLEEQLVTWRHVEDAARDVFRAYGYGEIRTPVLEETQLFVRSVGEATDIVEKEMYSFADTDRHKTAICLRPENTAGVVRALLEAGRLIADAEVRVYYVGPMFRRERPQRGRYRQFHQIGAEVFGLDAASIDVEQMAMLHALATRLGLSGLTLLVNTLGDADDRPRYAAALREYLAAHESALSDDSKRRLATNPLRVLDSKDDADRALLGAAPKPRDFLNDAARAHFDAVQAGLARLSIPFVVDDKLVRGLDYYTRTVFELVAETGLGAQNAVGAGGRYDGLVSELGGRPTPALGWAAGVERLVLLLEDARRTRAMEAPTLLLIGPDSDGRALVHTLAYPLRARGVAVEVDHRERSVKALMKRADKAGARYVAVVGEQERKDGRVNVKKMADGSVEAVALDADAIARAVASR